MSLLRDPLIHFLVLGALLFGLYSWRGGGQPAVAGERDIVVSAADVERIASQWSRQWRRPPTERELAGLIEDFIEQEVLYREALALGLDRDDTIIRRRLAQKMEFLSADLADQAVPTDADVETFFRDNIERFTWPARVSFGHVFFSSDRRGEATASAAERALIELRSEPDRDPSELGDPFLLARYYGGKTEAEIAAILGTEFAAEVMAVETGSWQGPVRSGYGLHLVLVEERVPTRVPELDEVRTKVEREMATARREEMNTELMRRLRARYTIRVEMPTGPVDQPAGS